MINKRFISVSLGWLLVGWLFICPALAQQRPKLTIADVWQSGMVIQRNQPVTIWGRGLPGAAVRAVFRREKRTATVAADSSWLVTFSARPASVTPVSIRVESQAERIILTDVLIGDVWLCAGQSNMAFELKNDRFASEILPKVHNSLLRLLNRRPALTTYKAAYKPSDRKHLLPDHFYQPAHWQSADSASARLFSAVGYYAGQRVQQQTGIPIGLISVAVGGSPTEAWLRPDSRTGQVVSDAVFKGDWLTNPALEPWCIERGHENLDSLLLAARAVPKDSLGYNHPFKPGFLYAAAIQPLLRLGIAGILWYQGESNALSQARVVQHEQLFPQLLADWRADWQRPDLPVYFCQLSSIGTERGYKSEYWPLFRDSQRRMADSLPHVGMAVTSDVGHAWDVHPTNKKAVGERLAGVMLAGTYEQNELLSPSVKQIVRSQTGWTITFADAGTGLHTADRQPVRGFALGDETGPKTAISATLLRQTVKLETSDRAAGTYLYYGWQPFSTANVVNSAGLPLSTFRLPLP
ncbi:sialate O-acetylesterase [Spirosoma pomorum]